MSGRKVVYKKTYAKGEGTRTATRREPAVRQTPKEPAVQAGGGARVLIMPRETETEVDEQPSVATGGARSGGQRTSPTKTAATKPAITKSTNTKSTKTTATTKPTKTSADGTRTSQTIGQTTTTAGKKPAATRTSGTTAQSKAAKNTMTEEQRSKRTTPAGSVGQDGTGPGTAGTTKPRAPRRSKEPPRSGDFEQPVALGDQAVSGKTLPKPHRTKRLEPPQTGEQTQPRRAPHASRAAQATTHPLEEMTRDRTTIVLPVISGELEPSDTALAMDAVASSTTAVIEQQPTIELRAASRAHTVPLIPPSRRTLAPPPLISLPPLINAPLLDASSVAEQATVVSSPLVEQATVVSPPRREVLGLPDLSLPRARNVPRARPYVPSKALALPPSSVRRAATVAWAQRARAGMTRQRKIALAAVALVVLIMTATGIPLAVRYISLYQRDTALVSTAMAHLKSAETALGTLSSNPFDEAHIAQAQSELAAAHTNFWQIQGDLGSVPGIASAAPVVGNKLAGARKLVPLALEATQGGIVALNALSLLGSRLKDPFGATSGKVAGLTTADWATLTADFTQIEGIFSTAVQQINALQPSDLTLDPRLGPAVQNFRKALPNIENGLSVAQTVIALGPQLLGIGTPVNYLVEVLDSTELRPGGGFVGNYGFLTMSQGLLGDVKMRDVDLLDRSPANLAKYIPVPSGYSWFDVASSWGLRDSNIEANFPTSAQFGEQLLKELGDNTSVQGVITITPWLIQNAMKITGPITVPQFNETVTADNLINTIHKYQLGAGHGSDLIYDPSSGSSQRKAFSADLFAQFIALVKKDLSSHMSQFVRLFTSSFQSKDIQVYLNSSKAEALLSQYNLASTIASPAGDGLMVVDANITGNKANYFMSYTMNDTVTIDAQGNATHHTTLSYAWPISASSTANEYGGSAAFIYDDYVRVYTPAGSTLLNQSGWAAAGTSTAYNRAVFAGHLFMSYGQTAVITLDWKSPHVATHDADGWHYATFLEKQAGDTWKFTEQVTLPKGCTISGTPGLLKASNASHAALTEYLTTDVSLKLDYGGCS